MHIVLSVGGGMINPSGEPDLEFLKAFSKMVSESKHTFGIVTGGGRTARAYANAARALGANDFMADETAIISTHQNAALLIAALGKDAFPKVLRDFDDAKVAAKLSKVVVMGGTVPGITTDTDSVLLAEATSADRMINVSNVDAIYDSNPRENPKAKRYTTMSYDELISLAVKSDARKAGTNFVFDLLACKLIARSKIETHFVSGKNLDDLKNAIEGKKHSGTVVKQ